jgi:putative hemolysin
MKKINILIITLITIFTILLSGCGTKYICADGSEAERPELCSYNKVATVRERDAENSAENYVQGYLKNKRAYYTQVTTYLEKGDYYTKFIISERDTEDNYETLIKIDGIKGTPECVENCDFMNSTIKEETQNPASLFCEERGGRLRTDKTEEGEINICMLPTGKECEEWAFFKGECP